MMDFESGRISHPCYKLKVLINVIETKGEEVKSRALKITKMYLN